MRWQTQQNPTLLCDFVLLIFNRSKTWREEGKAGEGGREGVGIVVVSRCSAHSRPLAPLEGKSARKRARNPHSARHCSGGERRPRHAVQSPWQRDLRLPPPKGKALERASRDQNHNPISVPREQRGENEAGKERRRQGRGREREGRGRERETGRERM